MAACNPHDGNSLATLSVPDPSENWFTGSYHVRPFHDTLNLLIWNYQALNEGQEYEYVQMKMNQIGCLQLDDENKRSCLAGLVCRSQELMRVYAKNHLVRNNYAEMKAVVLANSSVSQRDIQRVFTIYGWLKKLFDNRKWHTSAEVDDKESFEIIKCLRGIFVALAVVYYCRLNAVGRKRFCDDIDNAIPKSFQEYGETFRSALKTELNWMIDEMELPSDIAKTEALKENIFCTVVCTMTRIPLIIVGQPGSSKTLSFKIVTSNLLGESSPKPTFKNCEVFKALDPHFYQCSPNTSSIEIENVFRKAINRQACLQTLSKSKFSVVMLDEAGLPDKSHESLKVLHYYLDDQVVAFVCISNHILDAAKMNRAVTLFRPDASEDDIKILADGCLCMATDENLDFSRSYIDLMTDNKINFKDFFGLRDFIYFCNYARRSLAAQKHQTDSTLKLALVKSLQKNFFGSKHFEIICKYFLNVDESVKEEDDDKVATIFRSDVSEDDIKVLVHGCQSMATDENLDFSGSYIEMMKDTKINVKGFFGLRDFIGFRNHFRRTFDAQKLQIYSTLKYAAVFKSLQRNFSGSEHFEIICKCFLHEDEAAKEDDDKFAIECVSVVFEFKKLNLY